MAGRGCGSWWSARLWNAPAPEFGAPFSARRLLVDADQCGVEHQVLVVTILDQLGEDLLPDPRLGPAAASGGDIGPVALAGDQRLFL